MFAIRSVCMSEGLMSLAKPVRPVDTNDLPIYRLYPSRGRMLVVRVHRNFPHGLPEYVIERYVMYISPNGWVKKRSLTLNIKDAAAASILEQRAINWCLDAMVEDEHYVMELTERRSGRTSDIESVPL